MSSQQPSQSSSAASQEPRLVDMLAFDSDDDFDDRTFRAYDELSESLQSASRTVVVLLEACGNYQMFWSDDAQPACAAARLLGLRAQRSDSGLYHEAWFKTSRTAKLDQLVAAGWDVRIADFDVGPGCNLVLRAVAHAQTE